MNSSTLVHPTQSTATMPPPSETPVTIPPTGTNPPPEQAAPAKPVPTAGATLHRIIPPGQVTELRALNVPNGTYLSTWSGYFDDVKKLAEAARDLDQQCAGGIYIVPNPIVPALLARRYNRVKQCAKADPTTSDTNIVQRLWLLVDVDAVRPSNISSSNAEHEAALALALKIQNDLSAKGWPLPIRADSGNGSHVMFRIDEPVDDADLVKRCLGALAAQYDTLATKVDTTCYNPARIWKCYGTCARKGDSMPDRPHRRAKVLECPNELLPVPHDLLAALAAEAPAPVAQAPVAQAGQAAGKHSFNIDKWLTDYQVPVSAPEPYEGGRRWVFDVCPWNSNHTNRSAYIIQFPSGALVAGCHHAGCSGKGWDDLKALYKTTHTKRKSATTSTADTTGLHLTEQGNSERFVAAFGVNFRWVDPWGKWLAWDGIRWCPDATRTVEKAAMNLPEIIRKEITKSMTAEQAEAFEKWATSSERVSMMRACLEFAKSMLAVTPDQLDKDNWLLNCNNGTLDLRTGKLKPHDKADLITKLAPVDYDEHALCPRWERFLCEVFNNDAGLIDYIWRLLGLCLTGDDTEHIFPIFWGDGRNGKGTLIETQCGIMGDYGFKGPETLLMEVHNKQHPCEIASLAGRRLVYCCETREGETLNISRVKEFTGDSVLTARKLYCEDFTFPRTFKLLLLTNPKPRIHDPSAAAWERVQLVPFTVQFIKGTTTPPDKQLLEKLKAEWPGILAWAVRGNLARLNDGGLHVPDAVKIATAEYRKDEDVLAGFIGEIAQLDASAWTPMADLKAAFEQASELKWGRTVTDRLRKIGCTSKACRHEGKRVRGWTGIRLMTAQTGDDPAATSPDDTAPQTHQNDGFFDDFLDTDRAILEGSPNGCDNGSQV